MPLFFSAFAGVIISIAAINLAMSNDYPRNHGFGRVGKVFGVAEASDSLDMISSGTRSLVSGTIDGVQRLTALDDLDDKAVKTLPQNGDNPRRDPARKGESADIDITCGSSLVMDMRSASLLYEKNAQEKFSIASISKLMTALTFLDYNPGWDAAYEIKPADRREGGIVYLDAGDKVRVKDLFYSSLVASDNIATIAMMHATGMTEEEFVREMNMKARLLGLENTSFADPLGLDNDNVSTALEVAKFAQAALANEDIKKATLTKKYEFQTLDGKSKTIHNTDNLLSVFPKNGVELKGGKTGYTEAAGYCFVGEFTDKDGNDVISVVLGSKKKEDRFRLTHQLIDWVYKSFSW